LESVTEGGEETLDVIELRVTVETGECTLPGKVDDVVGVARCDKSVVVVEDLLLKPFINPKSAVSCCCMIFWRSSIVDKQAITPILSLSEGQDGAVDVDEFSLLTEGMDLFSLLLTVAIVRDVVDVGMFEEGGCGDGVRLARARLRRCGIEREKSVSDSEPEVDSTSSVDLVVVERRRFRIFDDDVSEVTSSAGEGVFITRRRERICGTFGMRVDVVVMIVAGVVLVFLVVVVVVVVVVDDGGGCCDDSEGDRAVGGTCISSCTSSEDVSGLRPGDDKVLSLRRMISFFNWQRRVCRSSSTKGGIFCSRCSRSRKVRRRHE
jgi:hypothetical protein